MGGSSSKAGSQKGPRRKGMYSLDKKPIGKGQFVKVYKGLSTYEEGLQVAVKAFNKKLMTPEDIQAVKDEVDILVTLDHPNIVKYYEWYENKKYLYVVSQYVKNAVTLHNQLDRGRKDFYSECEISKIMRQLYQAEEYLQQNNIIHRNIVPNNVMVDTNLRVTLIDFGLARLTSRGKQIDTKKDVSQFTAPESYNGEYTNLSDVWSLGNLAYLLFAGKLPFSGDGIMNTFKKSSKRNLTFKSSAWAEVSREAKDMIKEMIVGDPDRRAHPRSLVVHEWFDVVEEEVQENDEEKVDERILLLLREFQFKNKLQKIFVHMLVNMLLDDEEFPELNKKFNAIDKDQDGVISVKELFNAFESTKIKIDEKECKEIIKKLDFSDKMQINFTEFLVATLDRNQIKQEPAIQDLFKFFDTDKDKKIEEDDILREIQAVDNNISKMELNGLVEQYARTYKNCLTYEEVEKLIMSVK